LSPVTSWHQRPDLIGPCRHRNGAALEFGRSGMPKTVMIVEDNELNMKLFHDLLEAHGYHPVGTSDGIGALDLARKRRPDLILMDIQLPEVSGLEVTKWLKEDRELKAIPVVAVLNRIGTGDDRQAHDLTGDTPRRSAHRHI